MIEHHVIANDRRLTDDNAGSVVDEESPSDHGPGMDLNAGQHARDLGQQSGQERDAQLIQGVRDTVRP